MKILRKRTVAAAALLSLFPLVPFAGAALLDDDEKKKDETEETEEEEEKDDYLAVVGGDIYTGTGSVLRGATLLSKNGKIEEIGYDLDLPDGTEKVDARGMRVYPGLVALSATSRITRGLFGAALTARELDPHYGLDDQHSGGHDPHNHGSSPADSVDRAPEEDYYTAPEEEPTEEALAEDGEEKEKERHPSEDSFDPFSEYMVLALSTGITTAEQSGVAMKLRRGEIDGVYMNDKNMQTISYAVSNPSSIRSTKEKFAAAAKYLREYRAWEEIKKKDKEAKEPSKKGVDTGFLRVLRGEALARFNSNSRADLLGIARLAQRYGFRPVIVGCIEGWAVADELGRAGAYAIVTPRSRRTKNENLVRDGGSSIENAAILHRSGVQVAVMPGNTSFELSGMTGRDLLHLPIEAGFAVRGGLSDQAALESITIVPARLLGVDHRVGSLEIGKDADVIVTDGDLLHYQTFVQYAIVAGKEVYDKEDELFFAHIRPRPELPPLDPTEEEGDEGEPEGSDEDEGEEGEHEEGEGEGEDEDGR